MVFRLFSNCRIWREEKYRINGLYFPEKKDGNQDSVLKKSLMKELKRTDSTKIVFRKTRKALDKNYYDMAVKRIEESQTRIALWSN